MNEFQVMTEWNWPDPEYSPPNFPPSNITEEKQTNRREVKLISVNEERPE